MAPSWWARFAAKIESDPFRGCWLWTGATGSKGYGQFRVSEPRRRMVQAHRLVYSAMLGSEVPAHLVVDHLCFVRRCVNPDHLRLATGRINMMNRAGLNQNNRSGVRGVHWHSERQKWRVKVAGRMIGRFDSLEEAEAVARRVQLERGAL